MSSTTHKVLLSLAKRLLRLITNNKENQLKELKEHVFDTQHPRHIVDDSFTKYFNQSFKLKVMITLLLLELHSLNHNFDFRNFHSCLDKIKNKELKNLLP